MQGNSGRLRRNRRKFPVTTDDITIAITPPLYSSWFFFYGSSLSIYKSEWRKPFWLLHLPWRAKEQFLRDFAPVAAHVQAHEPDTLAYEVLLSEQDNLQVLVLERYKDKDHAYLIVHKSSEPFLAFRPKLKAMQDAGYVTVSSLDAGVVVIGVHS
jgi:quinol monooxygenase YgiN